MKTLNIDESGTYSQEATKLDPENPIFLLAGVIIDRKSNNKLSKEFKKLKLKYFQRKDVVFHASEFTHPTRSKQVGMEQFTDAKFRERFYRDLNKIIAQTDFKIVGFVIHV